MEIERGDVFFHGKVIVIVIVLYYLAESETQYSSSSGWGQLNEVYEIVRCYELIWVRVLGMISVPGSEPF